MRRRCWAVVLLVLALVSSAFAVYSEDFSKGVMPDDFLVVEGVWQVEDGRLIGESAAQAIQGRVVFGPEMEDFVYSVDVTVLSVLNSARWFSIFFRAPYDGAAPYHMFTIRQGATAHNGTELAFRNPGGNWDVRRTKPYKMNFDIGETHNIKVAVCDDVYLYFIDDELQFAAIEDGYADYGIFGLHVNGAKVAFDNIKIEPYDRSKYRAYENEAD